MFAQLKQASSELNQLKDQLKPNDPQSKPSTVAVEEFKTEKQPATIVCTDHDEAISSFCAECRKFGCEFCGDDHSEHRQ